MTLFLSEVLCAMTLFLCEVLSLLICEVLGTMPLILVYV